MRTLWLALALAAACPTHAAAQQPVEDSPITTTCLGVGRIRGAIFDPEAGSLQAGIPELLDRIARLYQEKCPGKVVLILGHAFEMPTPELNEELSALRARTIRHELATRGIPPAKLIAVGLGDTLPLVPSDTPDAMRLNRRVAFRVVD